MSYLNNEDSLVNAKPKAASKHRSSISLSDQFEHSMGSISAMKLSDLSAKTPEKKAIIDHPRIANYAFAFDIDGVLVRGPCTIPYGVEAIKYLNGENPYNIQVPYIFVTNGGGKHESVRAKDLSTRLETEVSSEQIVQGHTPMKDLATQFDNVLVVGGVGEVCRKVAESYGYQNVYTPLDIMYWNPSVTPYYDLTEEDKKHVKRDVDFSKVKFDAILVFADSRNWAADQQIILELLMSKNGYMGTVSDTFEDGPSIYFAHSDFVWSTNYKLVRYGMGALQVSLAALYREHTGQEMKVIRFGKPQLGTFKYADKILKHWRRDILEDHNSSKGSNISSDVFDDNERAVSTASSSAIDDDDEEDDDDDDEDTGLTIQNLSKLKLNQSGAAARNHRKFSFSVDEIPPPSMVYFVGDTPESDIRFANSFDESWFSILVKTGVYQENSTPKFMPKHLTDNVLEAVRFAVHREHEKELKEWNEKVATGQV